MVAEPGPAGEGWAGSGEVGQEELDVTARPPPNRVRWAWGCLGKLGEGGRRGVLSCTGLDGREVKGDTSG